MKFALAPLLFVFNVMAADNVIYGVDDRHEVYQYQDPAIVELARSTVALLKMDDITLTPEGIHKLEDHTLRDKIKACLSERFVNQPVAAFCSGFLVAPNKIITAGHCIEDEQDCKSVRFVFDYNMRNKTQPRTLFATSQVYSCKKVLGQAKVSGSIDFAIVELDREVDDRTPLKLSDNSALAEKDEMLVIGHPSGLPKKITDKGVVRTIKKKEGFFVTNLDTYAGNSGSPVINSRTHEVEGILVRGDKDYEEDEVRECKASNYESEFEGRGEDVTLISRIHELGVGGDIDLATHDPNADRYIFLPDATCNHFRGNEFIREVELSYCGFEP